MSNGYLLISLDWDCIKQSTAMDFSHDKKNARKIT